jgi:catechol 2,3-dioxygenase-like lactoylglutathione lyase family enzyme
VAAFKINHLHFKTPDPQKTAQWYVDNLGAKIVSEISPGGTPIGFRVDLHGVPLNVTGFVPGQELDQFYGLEHVAIDTDDLPGTVEQLKGSGNRILEERNLPDGRKVCFFEGPEGVRLEVLEMTG